MKVIGRNKAFSSRAVVLLLGLLLTGRPSADATPLKAGTVIESSGIVSKQRLSVYFSNNNDIQLSA